MDLKHIADLYGEELKTVRNKSFDGHSPRARQIIERNRLNSYDGVTIDEHDQFYRDHKLLLFLFRVCIRRSSIYEYVTLIKIIFYV